MEAVRRGNVVAVREFLKNGAIVTKPENSAFSALMLSDATRTKEAFIKANNEGGDWKNMIRRPFDFTSQNIQSQISGREWCNEEAMKKHKNPNEYEPISTDVIEIKVDIILGCVSYYKFKYKDILFAKRKEIKELIETFHANPIKWLCENNAVEQALKMIKENPVMIIIENVRCLIDKMNKEGKFSLMTTFLQENSKQINFLEVNQLYKSSLGIGVNYKIDAPWDLKVEYRSKLANSGWKKLVDEQKSSANLNISSSSSSSSFQAKLNEEREQQNSRSVG